jgi:alpha-mannosidase
MHDTTTRTTMRLERFVKDWLEPAVLRETRPLDVAAWTVGGEPVPFAQAAAATYEPHPIGEPWGRPWDTVWFRVTGAVPAEWRGEAAPAGTRAELVVDLGFTGAGPGFQAEGTAWTTDGRIIKAVEPRNQHVPLAEGGALTADGSIDLFVEAAANPDVPGGAWTRPTPMGAWETAGDTPIYALRTMHVALVDETVTELLADVRALSGLVRVLPPTSPRAAEVLRACEDMLDAVEPDRPGGRPPQACARRGLQAFHRHRARTHAYRRIPAQGYAASFAPA